MCRRQSYGCDGRCATKNGVSTKNNMPCHCGAPLLPPPVLRGRAGVGANGAAHFLLIAPTLNPLPEYRRRELARRSFHPQSLLPLGELAVVGLAAGGAGAAVAPHDVFCAQGLVH